MLSFGMRSTLLVVLVACGGGATTPPPAAPTPPAPTKPAAPPKVAVSPEAACDKFMALKTRCKQFESVEMNKDQCVAQFKESAANPGEKDAIEAVGHCFVDLDSCEEVMNCVTAASEKVSAKDEPKAGVSGGTDKPDHACDPKWATAKDKPMTFGAAGVPKDDYDKRNGATAKTFKDVKSSKDKPAEMCGIPAENAWLTTLSCDNGKQPVTRANVETFRVGSLGPGGRCGSIIDKYSVKCPEASYDIFIDAYICPSN